MTDNVKMFPDRRSEVLHDKVRAITSGMSDEDLDTLQNDRIGGFEFPQMPTILAECFREWNSDCGHGEVALSHENIHQTHTNFYEYIADHASEWGQDQVAMALAMLANGNVGPGTPSSKNEHT